jgi:hypothetical protein
VLGYWCMCNAIYSQYFRYVMVISVALLDVPNTRKVMAFYTGMFCLQLAMNCYRPVTYIPFDISKWKNIQDCRNSLDPTSSCSTSGTRHVTLVWHICGKDRIRITRHCDMTAIDIWKCTLNNFTLWVRILLMARCTR